MNKPWLYVGKELKITLNDGSLIQGIVETWDDELSMDSNEDEITINHYSYPMSVIESFEVL